MKITNVFPLFLLLTLLASNTMQSQNWYSSGVKGDGPKVTEEFDLASFNEVSMNVSGHVYLRQGSTQSVKIEAQQNILDLIERDVDGGTWKIKFNKNVKSHDGIKIWITIPDLEGAYVSGSGDIEGEGNFTGLGNLHLAVSGSGSIDLDSDSESMKVSISGSGDVEVEGNTGNCEIRISGSGDVEALDLRMVNCKVKISGSGDASVNVDENLDVSIVGSGDVVYEGNPRVKSKITGSGDVTSK